MSFRGRDQPHTNLTILMSGEDLGVTECNGLYESRVWVIVECIDVRVIGEMEDVDEVD